MISTIENLEGEGVELFLEGQKVLVEKSGKTATFVDTNGKK